MWICQCGSWGQLCTPTKCAAAGLKELTEKDIADINALLKRRKDFLTVANMPYLEAVGRPSNFSTNSIRAEETPGIQQAIAAALRAEATKIANDLRTKYNVRCG